MIEELLSPISGENPAGENLQYSGLYDEIREARRSEENLEQGEWKIETKTADWYQVETLAKEALINKTKDLQICVWLVEAMVKLYGFTGLKDGLTLIRGLLEQFWENLYPEVDEGDLEARANNLSWLDRQLSLAIKEVLLTKALIGENYSYLQAEDAKRFDIPEKIDEFDSDELKRVKEIKGQAAQEGKINGEQWRIAKNTTKRIFYEEIFVLLDECRKEFQLIDKVIDSNFGDQTPGLALLKKSLDEIYSFIEKIVKEKRITEPDAASPTPISNASEVAQEGLPNVAMVATAFNTGAAINSRQAALKQLKEIANFFRKAEPHSPISYLIERAIKWGEMPLEKWLADVVKNSEVLEGIRETLGFNTSESSKENEESVS